MQVGKRSGAGLRRALRVPPHEEPKALADFLRAASALAAHGEGWASAHADDLSARLLARSVVVEAGRGWGLGFPYASRFVNVDAHTPNLYVTTAACQALLDYHDLTRDATARAEADAGGRFIVDGLGWFEHGGEIWLRYWAGLETPTINVQASAAALLARLGRSADADRAARVVVATQRADGSWPYSADGRASYVDGFHTGFTLQGLAEYGARRGVRDAAVDAAVERGFAYFKRHLLTPDGLPRAFADGKVDLDGQNVAQCVQTLVVCGGEDDRAAAVHLWRTQVEPVLTGRGGRFPALRWVQGPAVLATAYLLAAAASSSA